MFFEPIPDRSKDISSINIMEFLLRKQAHMIVCHTLRNYELCALWQMQNVHSNEKYSTFFVPQKKYLHLQRLHFMLST